MRIDMKNIMAAAGLLHDIGKLIRRGGGFGTHHYNSYSFIKQIFENSCIYSDKEVDYIAKLARFHHDSQDDPIDIENGKKNIYLNMLRYSDGDSASERKEYTGENEPSVETEPLSSILSAVNSAFLNDAVIQDILVYYPSELYPFHPPEKHDGREKTPNLARNVLDKFTDEVKYELKRSTTKEQFILSLNFLLKKYTSFVTSSGKEDIRDISLYHHSFTTAAFAVCRLLDYEQFGNRKEQTYMLLTGRIYGIQEYIFDNINKNIEKPLKRIFTRSSLISVLNTIIPYQITRELTLYPFNIIFSGGGTFSIVLPQVYKDKAEEILENIKLDISKLFENKIYLEYVLKEFKIREDQNLYSFEKYFKEASYQLNSKKYNRTVDYLLFDNSGPYYVCKNCGINTKKQGICTVCDIENKWMDILLEHFKVDYQKTDIQNLLEPCSLLPETDNQPCIYFDYAFAHEDTGQIMDIKQTGKTRIKKTEDMCKNCYDRDSCDTKGYEGDISLNCLAGLSKNDPMMATAKLDVDDLGFLLYEVYPFEKFDKMYPFSISRLSYISDTLDSFFTTYLKKLIETLYGNSVLILYSGGDDILLTGKWEDVIKAVIQIERDFGKFIARSDNQREITLSASIVFHRSNRPFNAVMNKVTENMDIVKKHKDGVIISDCVLTYQNLNSALIKSNELANRVDNHDISRKLLFDMLKLINMTNQERKSAIAVAKKAALFNYYMERNVISKEDLSTEKKEHIRSSLYDLVNVGADSLDFSRLVLELAIRKTKVRSEENE
ncbi:type III-A CRISPR-associated protein Cas10/Csm1 [Petroclostridium xylanilyticum]|uniref:type III-A CRISPR-associated protein Cas10/Csm1 n=1 Tax=Petroclostridium xylanilyticum TaxID=1792311 RepID=UPI0012FF62D7|nr:type III-A CRISPR-associated protein Cas10/Csm1 [Petroclostridium xylanilyticum]